jgi:hypothetical protein
MDLIRCPRCAKEVPGSSQFCRRCGYTIAWNLSTAHVAPPRAPCIAKPSPVQPRAARRTPPPTPSRPRKSGILAVLAIFGAVYFFSHVALRTRPVSTTPLPNIHFPSYNPPIFAQPAEDPTTVYSSDKRFFPSVRATPNVPFAPAPPIIITEPAPPWQTSSRSRYTYPNQHSNEQHSSERSSRHR